MAAYLIAVACDQTTCQWPAMVNFGGQLTMAFVGLDTNLYLGQSNDGLNWRAAYQPDSGNGSNRSFDSPGIASFNGKLYLAWVGTVGSGSNINIASSTHSEHGRGEWVTANRAPTPRQPKPLNTDAGMDFHHEALAFGPTVELEYKQVGVNSFTESSPSGSTGAGVAR